MFGIFTFHFWVYVLRLDVLVWNTWFRFRIGFMALSSFGRISRIGFHCLDQDMERSGASLWILLRLHYDVQAVVYQEEDGAFGLWPRMVLAVRKTKRCLPTQMYTFATHMSNTQHCIWQSLSHGRFRERSYERENSQLGVATVYMPRLTASFLINVCIADHCKGGRKIQGSRSSLPDASAKGDIS